MMDHEKKKGGLEAARESGLDVLVARPVGLEPTTFGLQIRRSLGFPGLQLSYERIHYAPPIPGRGVSIMGESFRNATINCGA